MQKLSLGERKELASNAARKRWSQQRVAAKVLQESNVYGGESRIPAALARGTLPVGDAQLPCYVLDNENRDRVFSLKGVVVGLIETEGGNLRNTSKSSPSARFSPMTWFLQKMTVFPP